MLFELYGGCYEGHVRLLDVFFSLPWAMKRESEQKKASDFEWNVCFLLLCVLKRRLSVVFAIMCRHILLRNRGIWLFVAKVVKYYGIRNVYTEIFYYDIWFWWLVSHIENFEFQYRCCSVMLIHGAYVRPFYNASSSQNLLILFSHSFLATEDRRIDSMSFFPHQENTYILCWRWYSTQVEKVRILAERQLYFHEI